MNDFAFGPRSERGYDHDAVETFPWPVVAGYDDIHRWMDQGLAVNAACMVGHRSEQLSLGASPLRDCEAGLLLHRSGLPKPRCTWLQSLCRVIIGQGFMWGPTSAGDGPTAA